MQVSIRSRAFRGPSLVTPTGVVVPGTVTPQLVGAQAALPAEGDSPFAAGRLPMHLFEDLAVEAAVLLAIAARYLNLRDVA